MFLAGSLPVFPILRSVFISGKLRALPFNKKIIWRVQFWTTRASRAPVQPKILSSLLNANTWLMQPTTTFSCYFVNMASKRLIRMGGWVRLQWLLPISEGAPPPHSPKENYNERIVKNITSKKCVLLRSTQINSFKINKGFVVSWTSLFLADHLYSYNALQFWMSHISELIS